MADPRVTAYAGLLVDRCIGVRPGWQVLVQSSPLARPLVEEVLRLVAEREAYALPRLTFSQWQLPVELAWARYASDALLADLAPLDRELFAGVDARIVILAPENTRDPSLLSAERVALVRRAVRPALRRFFDEGVPWVGCQYPCQSYAQEAEMSLREFEDALYAACLRDWDEEARRMSRYASRFDRADEVRIVGDGTDLRLSLAGRSGMVDAGSANVPGGEFFYCPVEDSAEGVITFGEFPAVYLGREVEGVRLRFEGGRVVEASAERGEDFLLATLATDDGASRLGELGIGCNPGVTRYMRNTLFDEKIDGTVHVALGAGFGFLGGRNESALHWDLVKDLRTGGEVWCDGELVQRNGEWVL